MSEYIIKERLINTLISLAKPNGFSISFIGEVVSAPEIVRCRDCEYYCEERRNTALGWTDKPIPICLSDQWSTSGLKPCHEVKPDGFCAWGERKDE